MKDNKRNNKKLGLNTASNIIVKLWSMVSIYIFIPLYIKILGEASYGLVSAFATLQFALNILGMGLANTLRREFAAGHSDEENSNRKYKLLKSVERIYFAIGLIIVGICVFGSDFIANDWLNIENLDAGLVSTVISLMGVSIGLQLISNLYAGCLFGLEKQVFANLLCVGWSLLKSVGSLVIIWTVKPDLVLFYGWHIITDLAYLLLLRVSISKMCPHQEKWTFKDFRNLETIWKYTTGILVISLISLVNRQLDKIIISKYLSLTDLGAYNVATTLGSLAAIVPSAVYISIFPRFTNYATTNQKDNLESLFLITNRVVNIVLSCMGGFIAVFASELICVWTHSQIYIDALGIVGMLVVLAVTVLEFQQIPYALALAYGNTKINVKVGLLFLPLVCISTYIGISNYGLMGAGVVYVAMMVGQTLLYQYLVCKTFFPQKVLRVILVDTALPLVCSVGTGFVFKYIATLITDNVLIEVALAVIGGCATLLLLATVYIKKDDLKILKR